MFPYLPASSQVYFHTNRIAEWDYSTQIEAEVEGTWNRSYPLAFFAADYTVKKSIYQSQEDISVRLSGFILNIAQAEEAINNHDQLKEIMGFSHDESYGSPSYYKFKGLIMNLKGTNINHSIIGCMISLKLAANYRGELIIDTYVTNENINVQNIKKGMIISGTIWLQGEIG